MTIENIALFKALNAKMAYLSQRQSVIAQNVANADTPGYKPRDLVDVDFSSVLQGVGKKNGHMNVSLQKTNEQHMGVSGELGNAKESRQKDVYEVAPTGNAVVIEEQLLHAGQTVMDYNMMTNLYQKQIGMIKIALGTQK